ncbi:MAG: H(+)/Cl(-) exchange transporter ClcA [Planctomycetaceae bacterium]|nr:H(+)/Cl(-) exchange transporter ClcA [Planctomycetaceae bacterium]
MDAGGESRHIELKKAMWIYLLALVIGVGVGTLGSAFHYCLDKVIRIYAVIEVLFTGYGVLAIVVAAVVGAVMVATAAVLVRKFAPETAGSGIQEIEGVMGELMALRWRSVLPVKFFGGVLSMGAGLVLGREGPTIHLGGCVGQIVGEKAHSDTHTLNTFLAAGATAGLSVAFSAPLGAILFMIEEVRPRFQYSFVALHAVIIASITANLVNDQVFGTLPQLPVQLQNSLPEFQPPGNLLLTLSLNLLLGALIGVLGANFNTFMLRCLRVSDELSSRTLLMIAAFVGAVVGVLMIVAPEYVGGGEALVKEIFVESPLLGFLLALLVVRAALTFLSYSIGVPGGIFAPMLALGALIGTSFGYLVHEIAPQAGLQAGTFAVAAMGALFAATVRAPLTGIVLVAEMTDSFELLPAMIVTCMTASIVAQSLGSRPIYDLLLERTLERRGIKAEPEISC